MTTTILDDQAYCVAILATMDSLHLVVPVPPHDTCYGVMELSGGNWLCVENECGRYKIYWLQDCDKDQAEAFFRSMSGGYKTVNERLEIVGCRPEEN